MDEWLGTGRQDRLQPFGGAAGQSHGWLARWKINDSHVAPEHSPSQAGAQRLGAGLLGGEPLRVRGRAASPPIGAPLFRVGETARGEPLSVTLERPLDALDVTKVAAHAYD